MRKHVISSHCFVQINFKKFDTRKTLDIYNKFAYNECVLVYTEQIMLFLFNCCIRNKFDAMDDFVGGNGRDTLKCYWKLIDNRK